jgi:hypothetical protein
MGLSGSLGASQFTYITGSGNPASATLRHGFQFTLLNRGQDIRRQPGITIQDALNNAPNTATYRIDGNAPVPQIGEKVEIRDEKDNDRRLFGGTVLDVEQIYEGTTDQLAYNVTATDFTTLFNKRRPYGTYINQSVSDIVIDLVSKYAPGFTTAHVQTNLAKVSITLDGSRDFVTVLSDLATAIGGGHWYMDYDMDLHFFHIAPPGVVLPPTPQPVAALAHMTVAEGAANPGSAQYKSGYYLFTHSFIYSDGTESAVQGVSNMLFASGLNSLSFTNIPLGVTLGTSVCIGRRIYYNDFISGYTDGEKIEKLNQFVQINDNTTTAFTTQWKANGASVATIVSLGYVQTFSTPLVATPGTGSIAWVLLSDQAAALNLEGGVSNGVYGNPNASLVSPPAFPGAVSTANSLPAGWPVGATLHYNFTASNANGETTLGVDATVVITNAGLFFTAPIPLPTGANTMNLYLSLDGVTYRRHSAGIFPGQRFLLSSTFAFWSTNPTAPTQNTAIIGIYRGWVGFNGVTQIPEGQWVQPHAGGSNNIVYFATADVAIALENAARNRALQPPVRSATSHPSQPFDPITGFVEGIQNSSFWNGGKFQFKYAYLYRDGTVSFASKASPTIEKLRINGEGIKGFTLQNINVGPQIGNLDVVARFIYFCQGKSSSPNAVGVSGNTSPSNTGVPVGTLWPIPDNDPDWTAPWGVIIIPDNTSTTLSQFSLNSLGSTFTDGTYGGLVCGAGNLPYVNPNDDPLSVDPIPMWPNPDGPSLENDTPPQDITNTNSFLLYDEQGGSQAFKVWTDGSQLRNRVIVIGSGSVTTLTAAIGDLKLYVADVSAFSPHGGTLKYDDDATGTFVILGYAGVGGVVGQAYVILAKALDRLVPQGVNIANFYQADDIDSQKLLSKVELDANGKATDGIHEYTIVDTSLKAQFQLFMRAQAELELFSKPIVKITYATRDPTRSGQTVHVDLDDPPCFGDFLVQSVTIDQIHDESDALNPRYTVTASSVRFELNDLLLQILTAQQNTGSGNSSAGVVAAAGGGGSSSGLPKRTSSVWVNFGAGNALPIGVGAQASFVNAVIDSTEIAPRSHPAVFNAGTISDDTWATLTTSTANGSTASAISAAQCMLEDRVDCWFEVQTPQSLVDVCLWVGLQELWTPAPPGGSNVSMCSFRYSPNDGDQGWVAQIQPTGVGHARTIQLVAPIQAGTKYIMRLQTFVGASFDTATVTFTVGNISKVIPYDANFPVAGVGYGGSNRMQPGVGVYNVSVASVAAKFNFRRFSIITD